MGPRGLCTNTHVIGTRSAARNRIKQLLIRWWVPERFNICKSLRICLPSNPSLWGWTAVLVWVWGMGCEDVSGYVRMWGCEGVRVQGGSVCVSVWVCESVKVCGGCSETNIAVSFCNTISKLLGDYCMHTHWPSPTCVCACSYGDRVTSNYPTLYQFTTKRLCLRQNPSSQNLVTSTNAGREVTCCLCKPHKSGSFTNDTSPQKRAWYSMFKEGYYYLN